MRRRRGSSEKREVCLPSSRVDARRKCPCTAILLPDTDWELNDPQAQFQADLDAVGDQCRADETKRMLQVIERTLKKAVSEPVELALNKPSSEMWDKILVAFKEALTRAEATYTRKAQSASRFYTPRVSTY